MKMTYGVKDKPKFGQLIVFALQQLLAIMAATIAVPMIVGNGMSTSAALFGAGVGTLIYILFTKAKSPVFLGSSFAFLGSMAAAFAGGVSMSLGYLGLIIGAVFAGLVYVVIALIVKFTGAGWVSKIMPAVVIGPAVAIIGLSLAGNAVGDLQKANYKLPLKLDSYQIVEMKADTNTDAETGAVTTYYFKDTDPAKSDSVDYVVDKDVDVTKPVDASAVHTEITIDRDDTGNITGLHSVPGSLYVALICGLITLFATMIASVFGKKMAKMIPFIIGICAGYAAAAIFTFIGTSTGNYGLCIIDYSALSNIKWLPNFTFITASQGLGEITPDYIIKIAVAYIPVAFVVFAEHIADHKNISSIIETDLLEDPGLHRTLLGDGVGSMAGAFFGGCPNTTYGESIGCVAISGNASVATTFATAILAIAISFVGPFSAFLATIPSCVMGGVCIALYGFIAVSGLKMLQKVDLDDNRNLFVASVILIAGVGGLSLTFGKITITSIACALILGIIANVILNLGKKKEK